MQGELFCDKGRQSENEKSVIYQDKKNRQARQLIPAVPPAGGGECAPDPPVDLAPGIFLMFIPEFLHPPRKRPHVCWGADGDAVTPESVVRCVVLDHVQPNIGKGGGQDAPWATSRAIFSVFPAMLS
jgi:hypothetical protein